MIFHQNDDIFEASVTKSRASQKIGLNLQEENEDQSFEGSSTTGGSTASRKRSRIVVVSIGGLFQQQNQDVRPGDELLEVNGIAVGDFPNGLADVKRFMKGEWSINIRVGRNHEIGRCNSSNSTVRIPAKLPQTPLASTLGGCDSDTRGDSRHRTIDSDRNDGGYGSDRLKSGDEKDTPGTPKKKRRGRRKSRESLGTLIRDIRSKTPADREKTVRRGKRPSKPERSRSRSKHSSSTAASAAAAEDSGHSRSKSKKKRSKKERERKKIQGVQCTTAGVMLEMNDGKRVSVDPTALMALMTEEDGKFVAISNRALDCQSKNDRSHPKQTRIGAPLVVRVSDDEDSGPDETKRQKPQGFPNLKHLRRLLQKTASKDTEQILPVEDRPSLSELKSLMRNSNKANNYSALSNLAKDPWIRTSMATVLEDEESSCDSESNVCHGQHQSSPGSLSLRDLLGERLKSKNHQKWEESSMVSSTMPCMTNLIDPGDLMKIRNFSARPGLNGATVEIMCKSPRSVGRNRWDVRILKRKNQRAGTSNPDSSRLVSVAAENLRHFV